VRETWFELQGRRLFLSHWPVDKADIQSVEAPEGAVLDPSSYRVEKESGKLALNDAPTLPVSVTYTGGYALPDEAPDDLKNATLLFVREGRIAAMREATTGLKSISHKDSRVMFNPTPTGLFGTGGSSSTDAIRAAHALVYHYGRLEV
jgi:hypothetical protein